MTGTNRIWSEEDEKLLRALVVANKSIGTIASQLQRTEASVIARGYKLGLRFGRPKSQGLGVRNAKPASE